MVKVKREGGERPPHCGRCCDPCVICNYLAVKWQPGEKSLALNRCREGERRKGKPEDLPDYYTGLVTP